MPEASPESRPPTVRFFDMRNDFSNVVSINSWLDTIPTNFCRVLQIAYNTTQAHILIQIPFHFEGQ
jgi:hypothetical protein